ncbi:MAG: GNAT family N-acetyltransferase [Actinomycetota bacterium]
MAREVRLCFLGDSFVAGVGDPDHHGWVGRLLADPIPGLALTGYNLGIRGNTSSDVLTHWTEETARRWQDPALRAVVVSFGVNDTALHHLGSHSTGRSVAGLDQLLTGTEEAALPVLVVGPPPVADPGHNQRILDLDRAFHRLCGARGVHYVSVAGALLHDPTWMAEVSAGDGAHPAATGYDRLTHLIRPAWHEWLRQLASRQESPGPSEPMPPRDDVPAAVGHQQPVLPVGSLALPPSLVRRGWSARRPTAADHARVLATLEGWWGGFGGPAGTQQRAALLPRLFFQHFTGTSCLLEQDGRLAAFLIGFHSSSQPDVGYVHFVGVEPASRRTGAARWLYEQFFAQARAAGVTTVRCITSPGNTTSIAFHQAVGFQIEPGPTRQDGISVQPDYDGPGLDRVSFVRHLTAEN